MSSNLLHVPFRKAEDISLGDQITSVISKEYFQTPASFRKDIDQLVSLRHQITDLEVSEDNLLLLKKYYIHVSSLESKFPSDAIEFSWYGTLGYHTIGPAKLKSILFERLNILFNIGSIYSQLAVSESRDTDEGLKRACLYFQYAAGAFQLLNDLVISSKKEPIQLPLDLHSTTINPLTRLMLAQAQETFWQKAVANKSKDSVIARLANQVSDLYTSTLLASNSSDVIRLEWIHHITVKKYHFKAAAEFRAALTSLANFNYGEEVSRLKQSLKSCEVGIKSKRYVSQVVIDDIKGLKEVVTNDLKRAERDNDLIYLKPVPNEKDLPPITNALMVKPIPQADISDPFAALRSKQYGSLLFSDLLPFIVIQTAQAYRERQESFVTDQIIKPINALDNLMNKFLTERNLPAAIDAIQRPENLPESILRHSHEIISIGGIKTTSDALDDIQKLALQAKHLLDGASERLDIEATEDNLLRDRQGSKRWTRAYSSVAGQELLNKISQLEAYYVQAKEGDSVIRRRFQELEPYIEVYCGGVESLKEFVPNSKYIKLTPDVNRAIIKLREALNEVKELELIRKNYLETVELKSRENNILPKIISEYRSLQSKNEGAKVETTDFEGIFEKHIATFNEDIDYISKQKTDQGELETKIDQLNTSFAHSQIGDERYSERQGALQTLEDVYTGYKELITNINEGSKFYNDFISEASQLLKGCDDFVYNRRIEARELENQLNRHFEKTPEPAYDRQSGDYYDDADDDLEPSISPPVVAPKAHTAPKDGVWEPSLGIKFG